ncbi:MAG: hypothetical protein V1668_01640 [Patescibacteria group bacterium]
MTHDNQKGLSALLIIIVVIIFCAVIGGAFLLLNEEKAKSRDAKRMSDMARIQAAFELNFADTSSYAAAAQIGCDKAGMLVSQCSLQAYIPTIGQMKDPGEYQYQVVSVPTNDGYGISFTLEKSYENFPAGRHLLTQDGIK